MFEHGLDLFGADRHSEAKNFHGPPLLNELALDPQPLLGHLLPTVVAYLLVPGLLPALLKVPLYL